jgi:hypothetical protein
MTSPWRRSRGRVRNRSALLLSGTNHDTQGSRIAGLPEANIGSEMRNAVPLRLSAWEVRDANLPPCFGGTRSTLWRRLLANQDVTEAPIHVAIVGPAKRPDAVALYTAALRSIAAHELIEIRDLADPSPLPTSVTYPKLDRAALFLCTASACSSPVFKAEDVRKRIQRAELQSAR